MMATRKLVLLVALALGCCATTGLRAQAEDVGVTGRVVLEGAGHISPANSTVVWLTPIAADSDSAVVPPMHAVLQQKNKTFEPHLLVVTKGSTVEFPNRDPWFHNVFSLFNGKRFDLGLYEAGTSRTVHFDREGISFIFCNIHPEMSAVVVVLASQYFAVPDKQGEFSIASVPPGRYTLHVWNENALPAALQALSRIVDVSATSHSVGTVRIQVTSASTSHKNKYGQDYEPPSPNNPVYVQPQ
jgi:plastocyanin